MLRKGISALLVGVMFLSGCSSEPAVMPSPDVSLYVLDLTRSGNAVEQFGRIQEDLLKSVTQDALGNPYPELGEVRGPSVTRMYFVGGNSFALRDFKLQNTDTSYELHKFVSLENNQTRSVKFWSLLSQEYGDYIKRSFNLQTIPSMAECLSSFENKFESTWSNQNLRNTYSQYMCDMALYSLSNFYEMRTYIETESRPGMQKASDVFGALSKVANIIRAYKKEYSDIEVSLIMATDGDHRVGDDSPSNLRFMLSNSMNPCEIASKVKQEYGLELLEPKRWLKIDARGIAALIRGQGDYPRQLNDFWQRCFFPEL